MHCLARPHGCDLAVAAGAQLCGGALDGSGREGGACAEEQRYEDALHRRGVLVRRLLQYPARAEAMRYLRTAEAVFGSCCDW